MKKAAIAAAFALALTANAKADVLLDPHLSGTGDNVTFDSFGGSLAIGSFNGQHTGFVHFTDLSGNPAFFGAANGNDIKIANTNNLQVQVFGTDNTTVLPTATDVFSLKGTGDVLLFVNATDGLFTFDLGQIDPSAQSGFTLTAVNGETISQFTLLDVGGSIADFEHYRIDVASVAAVPEPSTWAMMLIGLAGVGLFGARRRGTIRLA